MKTVAGGNRHEWEDFRHPVAGSPVGHVDAFHPRHPRGIRTGSRFFTPVGIATVVGHAVDRFAVLMVLSDGQRLSRVDLVERVIHAGWEHVPPAGNLSEFWNEI